MRPDGSAMKVRDGDRLTGALPIGNTLDKAGNLVTVEAKRIMRGGQSVDGGAPVPVAFFAVVSIGVIGLYLAFAIPIFLRWRHGARFDVGTWNNGEKYRWMNPIAVVEIIIMSIVGLLPTSYVGIWWNDGFAWKYVNYAIIVVPVALVALTIYWHVSVKHWFTGPKHNIDPEVVAAFTE